MGSNPQTLASFQTLHLNHECRILNDSSRTLDAESPEPEVLLLHVPWTLNPRAWAVTRRPRPLRITLDVFASLAYGRWWL